MTTQPEPGQLAQNVVDHGQGIALLCPVTYGALLRIARLLDADERASAATVSKGSTHAA